MCLIGILSGNLGTDNQIRGIIERYNKIHHLNNTDDCILNGLDNIILHPKNFKYFEYSFLRILEIKGPHL